jgi:hypothetical protein
VRRLWMLLLLELPQESIFYLSCDLDKPSTLECSDIEIILLID